MAKYTISGRSTVVGTNARAQFSLFGIASRVGKIVECGLFNTSTSAVNLALARWTAATNVGTGLTEVKMDEQAPDAELTGFAGHTGDGTVGNVVRQCTLGAAAGAGIIWTFAQDNALIVTAGTANGVGPYVPNGTGQTTDYHLDWLE
jgi:hypothetical protein